MNKLDRIPSFILFWAGWGMFMFVFIVITTIIEIVK